MCPCAQLASQRASLTATSRQDKKQTAEQFGNDQVKLCVVSYDVPPPPLPEGDPRSNALDPRYRDVPREFIPLTECLKDVWRE